MLWARRDKCKALAARFVAAVNAHDAAAMAGLITDDFTYIESWRDGISGRDASMRAVNALFAADPRFGLDVEATSFSDPYVLMRGWTRSDGPGSGRRRRATWRARCDEGLIGEWQSWAEGGPPPSTLTHAGDGSADLAARGSHQPVAL